MRQLFQYCKTPLITRGLFSVEMFMDAVYSCIVDYLDEAPEIDRVFASYPPAVGLYDAGADHVEVDPDLFIIYVDEGSVQFHNFFGEDVMDMLP